MGLPSPRSERHVHELPRTARRTQLQYLHLMPRCGELVELQAPGVDDLLFVPSSTVHSLRHVMLLVPHARSLLG